MGEMDRQTAMMVKQVLIKKTNLFLEEVENLIKDSKEGGKGVGKELRNIGRRQFQDIMNGMSEKASSVEEIYLFIGYQEAKDMEVEFNKKGWSKSCGNKHTVAENIVDTLKEVISNVWAAVQEEVQKRESNTIEEGVAREIRINIAEKFMGYLYWKATVVQKKG